MMRLIPIFAFLAALSAQTTYAGQPQTVFKATYTGKHSGLKVKTTRTLNETREGIYSLNTEAKALFASIKENSRFTLDVAGNILPLQYEYKRRVLGVKKEREMEFDWQSLTAKYSKKKSEKPNRLLNLSAGMLDEPTFQLQLQKDVKHNPAIKQLTYSYAKPGKIKTQLFYQHKPTTLNIMEKERNALFFSTQAPNQPNAQNNDKIIQIWVIPDYNYQIGKIKFIDEDGKAYELKLTSYWFNPELFKKFEKS